MKPKYCTCGGELIQMGLVISKKPLIQYRCNNCRQIIRIFQTDKPIKYKYYGNQI